MKNQIITSLSILAIAALSSCNRHIYVPNAVNAPLLKEKYEFKGNITPTNLQTAFAITDNIALMANGQYVYNYNFDAGNNNNDDLFIDNNTRGGVIEGAVGFFKPLDLKQRMVFDVYAGYGNGRFKTLDKGYDNSTTPSNTNDYLLKTHFNKFFLQPSIGFVHPVIEAAFSSRFSVVKFYDLYTGAKAFENDANRKLNFLQIQEKALPFFEPAFTFRVGYKYVKFQMQLLFSVPLNDDTYNGYEINEYFQPVAFGMGASVNIARWYDEFRKKK